MGYSIYLSKRDGSELTKMPVNPSTLGFKMGGDLKTYNIVDFGEVGQQDNRKLIRLNLASYLPSTWAPICEVSATELERPSYYADRITRWRRQNQVLKLTVAGTAYPLLFLVTISNLVITEGDYDVGDLAYELELVEHRDFGAREVQLAQTATEVVAQADTGQPRADTYEVPNVYTVVEGDTLWRIAKRQLNDGSRYTEIASLNNLDDPNVISPGQELTMP